MNAARSTECKSLAESSPLRWLLVVGHGTRDAAGTAEFMQLVDHVRSARPETTVEACFLELQPPTIAEGMARLKQLGADEVIAAPLLLFAAGHAKRDIPDALAEAAAQTGVRVQQASPLGCHPNVLRASLERYDASLVGLAPRDEQTALIMAGRGSLDAEANAEMSRFARLRYEARPVGWLQTCYIAIARPNLEEALGAVSKLDFGRVIVQPHLLFAGALLDGVRRTTAKFAAEHPDREVLVAPHLGPQPLLAAALLARVDEIARSSHIR